MDQNHSTTCIKSLSILEAVASILKELALAHSSNTFPHKSEKLKKAPSNAQSIQPFPYKDCPMETTQTVPQRG